MSPFFNTSRLRNSHGKRCTSYSGQALLCSQAAHREEHTPESSSGHCNMNDNEDSSDTDDIHTGNCSGSGYDIFRRTAAQSDHSVADADFGQKVDRHQNAVGHGPHLSDYDHADQRMSMVQPIQLPNQTSERQAPCASKSP